MGSAGLKVEEEALRDGVAASSSGASGSSAAASSSSAAASSNAPVPFSASAVEPSLMVKFPKEFLMTAAVVPARVEENEIVVFGAPEGLGAALEIADYLGKALRFHPAKESEIREFVRARYDKDSSLSDAIAEMEQETANVEALQELAADAPVVRLVDHLLEEAVTRNSSDIHVIPRERDTVVRFRIDGVLSDFDVLPRELHAGVVSRIKILARLDIAQIRLPQDGRIARRVAGREIDLRVSTIPTPQGERVVMRILDRATVKLEMEELGMAPEVQRVWETLIRQPHGILLVTGPTGSGKTTTLYTALAALNDGRVNILTVEDPVEYLIEGTGQIQVNPKINLTFASGLRSILRQDPDVIMVGEIRDGETARIAVQASLTGHLVLSTLHTNDAPSALPRLRDMGIESYLLASTVRAVLAQRLVRRLCSACRRPAKLDPVSAAALGGEAGVDVFQAEGCPRCEGRGFRGRSGIFELVVVDEPVRELILANAPAGEIRRAATKSGMVSMRRDGLRKILAGETTAEEVLRAVETA
ncbi:MAG: type II secretion system protein GspE [Candidatus Hydrogenedentota bacterium]|nr:MAG: type II secretion system protein GspE [Candidatus Hydrogenedentota bacterium]